MCTHSAARPSCGIGRNGGRFPNQLRRTDTRILVAALIAGAMALLSLTAAQAQGRKKPTGAQLADAHARVDIANGLIALGRATRTR